MQVPYWPSKHVMHRLSDLRLLLAQAFPYMLTGKYDYGNTAQAAEHQHANDCTAALEQVDLLTKVDNYVPVLPICEV